MRIWTSEHTFDHPWDTVVNAAYRKYPNPINGAVKGMDVVAQDYSHEVSTIDPVHRHMTLTTRNLNAASFLRVNEKLTYEPDPSDPQRTVLKQEATVSVNLPAFTDYCEKAFLTTYQTNALKGRSGVEWVIDNIKREYNEISAKVTAEMHELMTLATRR